MPCRIACALYLAILLAIMPMQAHATTYTDVAVLRVVDGDTVEVEVEVWPGTVTTVLLGDRVTLSNVRIGKFARRVIADVLTSRGNVSLILIAEGLARPYDGGRRQSWCDQ